MASTLITFDWEVTFIYSSYIYLNSDTQSVTIGNDNVKFILSAQIGYKRIDFSLCLRSYHVNKLICTIEYHSSYKSQHEILKKIEIGKDKTLLTSIDFDSNKISDQCEAHSATIWLKITFLDEKVSSFSNTWNFSGVLNTVNQAEILCEQLTNLKLNSTLPDVIIEADGKEFKVHSAVLAMRSSVFAAMFSDKENFKESKEKKVVVEDISGQVMETFLAFLYGQKDIEWKSIAIDLAKVADKYDVQPLLTACAISLSANVTVETAAKNFQCAHLFGMTECMSEIAKFICDNKADVKATDGWKECFSSSVELYDALFEAST